MKFLHPTSFEFRGSLVSGSASVHHQHIFSTDKPLVALAMAAGAVGITRTKLQDLFKREPARLVQMREALKFQFAGLHGQLHIIQDERSFAEWRHLGLAPAKSVAVTFDFHPRLTSGQTHQLALRQFALLSIQEPTKAHFRLAHWLGQLAYPGKQHHGN